MLTLTVGKGKRVRLVLPDGRRVWVMVCGASLAGGWLRLGFDAPADVKILREEIIDREPSEPPS